MRIPREKPEPGEWQTDKDGKRFRMVGQTVEYEMQITTSGGTMPESMLRDYNATKAERDAQRFKEMQAQAAEREAQRRNCPFSQKMHSDCTREKCALFKDGCVLASTASKATHDTKGLQCPFNQYLQACRTDCALYKNGCVLTAANTESEDR